MMADRLELLDSNSSVDAKSVTPCEVKVSMDDIMDATKKTTRLSVWFKVGLALIAFAVVGAAVAVPVILTVKKGAESSTVISSTATTATVTTATTTTVTTSSTTTATTTTTKTTTSLSLTTTVTTTITTTTMVTSTTDTTSVTSTSTNTTTTVTVVCVSPYAITANNTYVNILIDVDNCGAVGYACGSSYTSCSGGTCSAAPSVQLSNSYFIWTAAVNGSVDDKYFGVTLPFNITLYNTVTDYVYVSSNSVLCLGVCSSAYTETSLPTSTFPDATVFGYWDDLYVYSGTSQGIYYAADGNAPNRTLTFEYYTSHYGASNQYYHFQVVFFEAEPDVVQLIYFDSSDGGSSCTIGVQSKSTETILYIDTERLFFNIYALETVLILNIRTI